MIFDHLARAVEKVIGHPYAFVVAVAVVVVWGISGPLFRFSDTWQLVINTLTTISTGLIVFLIQNTQSRDTQAIHAKLDELIRVTEPARNEIILAEEIDRDELDRLRQDLQQNANK